MSYHINHLKELESESIFILREVAAKFENPVLMFSGGKDSILMVYLAYKAFYPAKIPFPLLHIDTGHNFPETIEYRDSLVEKFGAKLIVGSVEEAIRKGLVTEERGFNASRNSLQTAVLLDELEKGKWPSFVKEIKMAAKRSPMCADLLGQLEKSYTDKIGYWKHGGIVGVMGYGGGVIGRYCDQPETFSGVAHFHTVRVAQPGGK